MSKRHKQVYWALSYIEYLFILVSKVTGCVSISGSASLLGIPLGRGKSAVLIIYVISAGIKEYKYIMKKKTVLLANISYISYSYSFLKIWSTHILVMMNLFPWIMC